MKSASGKEISRPSDDPFATAQAMALRQSLSANQQHQRNVEDAIGWQDATEQALMDITDSIEKAKSLLVQGASDSLDADGPRRDRLRARAAHRGHQADRQHQLPRLVPVRRHRDLDAPVSADEHAVRARRRRLPGRRRGLEPGEPRDHPRDRAGRADVDQRRGPAVPGRRPGRRRRQAPRRHARRGRQPAVRQRRPPCAAPTWTAWSRTSITCSRSAPPTAPRPTAWSPPSAGSASSRSPSSDQLSKTEDADIAETLIELNSQTAAYQAALRAGASIVQTSLMDFLR